MSRRIRLCFALLPAMAAAQSLPSLVEEALRGNREILAAQKKYEAARQRPSQARALPDPMVSLGYASSGRPWPGAGLGREPIANAGVMVSQQLPFPGKRDLRAGMAAREADAEFQQYLAVRLGVIAKLKQAYHELHHAVEAGALVRRNQELLRNMLRVSESRYSVGRAAQQDVLKAQTQFTIFEAQFLRYEQERQTKEIEINALLNRQTVEPLDVPDEIPPGLIPATLDEMLAHARVHSPMLAKEQKMIERNQLAGNLAKRDYYPDYTVSAGYFNMGGMPDMYQVRVDFQLPARSRRYAAATEQSFATTESRRNYEAAAVGLQARIRQDYTAAETARKLIDLYQKAVIPSSHIALESAMSSYQTGSVDFMTVFSNFMTTVDYELMYHEEVMRFHLALARLEEMVGASE